MNWAERLRENMHGLAESLGNLLMEAFHYLALFAIIGAQLGARCAVYFGPRLIRPLVVIVCCVMALKLLLDASNPLVEWVVLTWP